MYHHCAYMEMALDGPKWRFLMLPNPKDVVEQVGYDLSFKKNQCPLVSEGAGAEGSWEGLEAV